MPAAHLLSIFDEFVSSYKDHDLIASPELHQTMITLSNALRAIVLVDGKVRGRWLRDADRQEIRVKLLPMPDLPADIADQLHPALTRMESYYRLPVRLVDVLEQSDA